MSDKPSIYEALSAVMDDVQAVRKGDRNAQQGYSFRGIDAVVNAVGPALRKHGVIAVPHATEARYRDVQTSTGKPSRECTVVVTYRFYGPAGDFIEATVPGESMDFGDKGAPKAMSVAYRIALLQALCIPTDEPDADSQSYERAPQRDDWDAAKPATDEQVNAWNDYSARITGAKSEQDIQNIGELVKDARGHEKITRQQYDRLSRLAAAKLAELGVKK